MSQEPKEALTEQFEKLNQLEKRISQFIAFAERSERKMQQREQQVQAQLTALDEFVTSESAQVRATLQELREITDPLTMSRFQQTQEAAADQTNESLKNLRSIVEEFRELSHDSCKRLDRATSFAVKGVNASIESFRAANFKEVAENSCNRVEKVALNTIERINQVGKWFYWKKAILVGCFSIFTVLTIGLYVNDEMPWESHKKVKEERLIAQAVKNSWTDLDQNNQQVILKHYQKKTGQA